MHYIIYNNHPAWFKISWESCWKLYGARRWFKWQRRKKQKRKSKL